MVKLDLILVLEGRNHVVSVWYGLQSHKCTVDNLVNLKTPYLKLIVNQILVPVFLDLEKECDTTWQYCRKILPLM